MASTLFGLRRSTIRFRITAVAAVVAAVVLGVSAVALVLVQRQQLVANLDRSLEQRADQLIASMVDGEALVVGADANESDRATQLVARDGTVLAASANLDGLPAIAAPPPGEKVQNIRTVSELPIDDDQFRVLSRRVEPVESSAVLHVAENIDDLGDAASALSAALTVTVPLVVVIMTGLVWWLVGRTLQPVESIRSEVTAITGTDIGRRVTVPPYDDEIGRLATTMNDMLDRLSNASEQQRRFVADASHELRTPLTRIRTELEVDLEQPDRTDLEATHRLVLDETIDLQRLVDDLLYLARSDAGAVPLLRSPLDLDDIVMGEIRRQRARGGPDIDSGGVSGAHVAGDRDQLGRLVRNLLDNAVSHAESLVTIHLAETETSAVLTVGDDGPGIAAEDQDAIFERFTRLDDARARADGGAGLGLAISGDIAQRHRGTLKVASEPGAGAVFTLVLPLQPSS